MLDSRQLAFFSPIHKLPTMPDPSNMTRRGFLGLTVTTAGTSLLFGQSQTVLLAASQSAAAGRSRPTALVYDEVCRLHEPRPGVRECFERYKAVVAAVAATRSFAALLPCQARAASEAEIGFCHSARYMAQCAARLIRAYPAEYRRHLHLSPVIQGRRVRCGGRLRGCGRGAQQSSEECLLYRSSARSSRQRSPRNGLLHLQQRGDRHPLMRNASTAWERS